MILSVVILLATSDFNLHCWRRYGSRYCSLHNRWC